MDRSGKEIKETKKGNNHRINFRRERNRARSCHPFDRKVLQMQLGDSHSKEEPEEKKILNVESKYHIFINVIQEFENILNQFEFDDNYEVYEKLLKIQSLIKKKISSFKDNVRVKKNNLKLGLENRDLGVSKSLTLSVQSVDSVKSKVDDCLSDDSFLKEFLIKVDCPFCLKSQADKINLIKHLDENCEPHLHKTFEKSKSILYSVFQILPNNTFKCNVCPNTIKPNIKWYIVHLNSKSHIIASAKAAKTKVYSEYLFCSCCKVQVANNYTQLDFHIRHEIHRAKSDNTINVESFLQKGIYCIYNKSKKFKCLICHHAQSLWETPKEILLHFEEPRHKKNIKINLNYLSVVYCNFCDENVHIFEIINHFNEIKHKKKEENEPSEGNFQLCFYCGFLCFDLMVLSQHMESQCQVINEIRKKNLKSLKVDESNLKESKLEDEAKEEHYIIVKDNMEIPKLFRYFTKFGEVSAIEIYNEKDVKINFSEKRSLEDILLLRNVLQIEGVKLEITIGGNLSKSNEAINKPDRNIESLEENKKIVVSHSDEEEERNDSDSSDIVGEDDELQNLFRKVSSHLASNAQKSESDEQQKLAEDCVKTLNIAECNSVGFLSCGLSFPVESISLYCESMKSNKFSLERTNEIDKNLIKKYYIQMCDSELWKSVVVSLDSTYPHIKCMHKETQKACTLMFDDSTMKLTNMLRDCVKDNAIIRSFCLIIRFWLSVHELKIRDFEYTVISILVFFFISQKLVDFPVEKHRTLVTVILERIITENLEFSQPVFSSEAFEFDIKKLFQKFLVFLDTFDFNKYVICLPIEHPIPKTILKKSEIMFSMNVINNEELANSMCILDPSLRRNIAKDVTEEDKNSLLRIVKNTIKHYRIK